MASKRSVQVHEGACSGNARFDLIRILRKSNDQCQQALHKDSHNGLPDQCLQGHSDRSVRYDLFPLWGNIPVKVKVSWFRVYKIAVNQVQENTQVN